MTPLSKMVLDLADALPLGEASDGSDGAVAVERVDVDLPMESRLRASDEFRASLPRHRLHTGFDHPVGRIRISFRRVPR